MPHALLTFSEAYKKTDPAFSKRCRQLHRSLERCKLAARRSADKGVPDCTLFSAMREFLADHRNFGKAFASRSHNLFFSNAEEMINDLEQLKRLDANCQPALSDENRESLLAVVKELL